MKKPNSQPPDFVEGDIGFAVFMHSAIVDGSQSHSKLVCVAALGWNHFEAVRRADEIVLRAVSAEARAHFGRTPITLDQFRELLETQLLATETARITIFTKARGPDVTLTKRQVCFHPALAQKLHRRIAEDEPDTVVKVFQTPWTLPDVMDEPTIQREVQRIMEFARKQQAVLLGGNLGRMIEAVNEGLQQIVEQDGPAPQDIPEAQDIWSGQSLERRRAPWLN